jgi:hypothetical protein
MITKEEISKKKNELLLSDSVLDSVFVLEIFEELLERIESIEKDYHTLISTQSSNTRNT